jgi:hypothetical protein
MGSKHRRCAFCNSAIHEGGSFVVFHPDITVTINGCTELVRRADFSLHSFPKVFCNWDCFHRFFGAEFIDALPPNPKEWQEEYYDHKYSMYVEID